MMCCYLNVHLQGQRVKIHPVGSELFHADRQTNRDRQTQIMSLVVSFRNLVNEPKTGKSRNAASFGQMKKEAR